MQNGSSREIKFEKISEKIYKDFAKAERLIALNSPIMQVCMYTCMILISWLGAKAVIASGNNAALGLTTGSLTALFTYAMQILMSLMMLSMTVPVNRLTSWSTTPRLRRKSAFFILLIFIPS